MKDLLSNLKIAFVAANGFEQSELIEPKKTLEHAGAQIFIISPIKGKIKGWI